MNDELEMKIRQRAQEMWEGESRPDGLAERHWLAAEREVTEETENAAGSRWAAPVKGSHAERRTERARAGGGGRRRVARRAWGPPRRRRGERPRPTDAFSPDRRWRMPARTEREDLAGARVLVVEDEFLIALEVEFLLRGFGCEVLGPAPSVVRALELLGRERPDAALLDLDLLDGMAVPVAELLASMRVPFALVTANDPTQIVEAPALRGVAHLAKPVGHGALRRLVAAL